MKVRTIAGIGGEKYLPYEERTGNESIVYFTRDLSPAGLQKIYEKVNAAMTGKIAVKLHTGEQHGPNIIPSAWVKELMASEEELKDAVIVETNTFYEGDRYTSHPYSSSSAAYINWKSIFCSRQILLLNNLCKYLLLYRSMV